MAPRLLENLPAGKLNCEPQAIPLRSLRRLLRGRPVEVAVEIGGFSLLVKVSKRALMASLRRAYKRGARTVPVADLLGILVVGD